MKEEVHMSDQKFYFKGLNGQITVYEDKVVIERGRFWGFVPQRFAGSKTIPMNSIMSVQFKEGSMLTNGFIQFGVKQGGIFNATQNATQDENFVMIKASTNNEARQIKEYIEGIILNRNKNQGTVIQQTSPADELKKFKELLDMGVISQDEFNAKKKQILGL